MATIKEAGTQCDYYIFHWDRAEAFSKWKPTAAGNNVGEISVTSELPEHV